MASEIADLPPNKRPINTVFQNYALFPHLTVAENVAFGLRMLGRPKVDIEARVGEMLALVQLSDHGRIASPISSRAGSSSGWRWPAPSRRRRRCCCSTSRSRRSI